MEKRNKLISIIIPVNSNNIKLFCSTLTRLSLNQVRSTTPFEIIVVDQGVLAPIKEVCETLQNYLNIKYIYRPLETCNNYNAIMYGYCVAEGEIIGHINENYWVSEDFINILSDNKNDITIPSVYQTCTTKLNVSVEMLNEKITLNPDWQIGDVIQKAQLSRLDDNRITSFFASKNIFYIYQVFGLKTGMLLEDGRINHNLKCIELYDGEKEFFVEAKSFEEYSNLGDYGFSIINKNFLNSTQHKDFIDNL